MTGDEGRTTSRAQAAREELKWRRQQAVLDVALDLVTGDGHDALTMQRIADELECGIASVYRLFPSKDALFAELQHQALDVFHACWLLGMSHLDEDLAASGLEERELVLTRAIGSAWFWVVVEDRYSPQVDLLRRLFSDRNMNLPDDQAVRLMPAAARLLDQARTSLDRAVEVGVIGDDNNVERSVVMIASLTGVTLTAKFTTWGQALFDHRALSRRVIRESFIAWGAPEASVDAAFDRVAKVAETGRLAPAIER